MCDTIGSINGSTAIVSVETWYIIGAIMLMFGISDARELCVRLVKTETHTDRQTSNHAWTASVSDKLAALKYQIKK